MKLTEDMLRRAFAEKDAKRERDAVRGNEKLLRFVSRKFQNGISLGAWYRENCKEISKYLADKYAVEYDVIADKRQKKACLNAAEYLYFRTVVRQAEVKPHTSRHLRLMAAVCVLAMFVPGKHLGFTVEGSSADRYLLTMFGGTFDRCGKYGFGVNVFEKAPERIREYAEEIVRGVFRD